MISFGAVIWAWVRHPGRCIREYRSLMLDAKADVAYRKHIAELVYNKGDK